MAEIENKELKAAELRGYSKGYAAGKRKKVREVSNETRQRKEDAFWQRAFIAALPAIFGGGQEWKRGDKPIASVPDRLRLVAEVADEAVKRAALHI